MGSHSVICHPTEVVGTRFIDPVRMKGWVGLDIDKYIIYRVFKKVTPKTFRNIFTSVKSFCGKFCNFVPNSYPHISTNFCRFILMASSNGVNFPRVPIVFTLSSWVGLFTQKMQMQLFGNDVIFSPSRVLGLVSSNYKQSITVRFFYYWRFTDIVSKLGGTYQ